MIYADHAATTALDADALEAMLPWMKENFANPSQPYAFGRKARKAVENARECIAACIHASPEEIFFTSGGTESDNWAIRGTEADQIIYSAIEHHAVSRPCQASGRPCYVLDVSREGFVSPEQLKSLLPNKGKTLVTVMLANNEIGTIQPIRDLAAISREKRVIFHTDAVQAVGHIPINVQELNVDLLSASAHKFNGPKGIGFLYIRKGSAIDPFHYGGSQEKQLRAGTEDTAAIIGMAAALQKNCARMEARQDHLLRLERLLLDELKRAGIDFLRNGASPSLPGLFILSFRAADGEALLHRLDLGGVCVSTGSACNSRETKLSHVLQAIHAHPDYAFGTIRISLGEENSMEDVKSIVSLLQKALG